MAGQTEKRKAYLKKKMKTCKNCVHYTSIQCHGHGEYWGECKKNRNDLICYDDTPCLQDIKTLRELYFKQKNEIDKIKTENTQYGIWKARYEIKNRHLKKVQELYQTAEQYIPKEKYNEYFEKKLKILNKWKTTTKQQLQYK